MALSVQCSHCKGDGCNLCDNRGWVMHPDIIFEDVPQSVDTGNVTDSSERVVTRPCPACEAAARERVICACGDEIGQAERIGLSQIGAICGNCAVGRKDYDARMELADLRARLAATENVALALGAMNHPPCFICGYNGPSYYQPEVHLCAERHHKYYYGKLTAFSELRALLAEGGEK